MTITSVSFNACEFVDGDCQISSFYNIDLKLKEIPLSTARPSYSANTTIILSFEKQISLLVIDTVLNAWVYLETKERVYFCMQTVQLLDLS